MQPLTFLSNQIDDDDDDELLNERGQRKHNDSLVVLHEKAKAGVLWRALWKLQCDSMTDCPIQSAARSLLM